MEFVVRLCVLLSSCCSLTFLHPLVPPAAAAQWDCWSAALVRTSGVCAPPPPASYATVPSAISTERPLFPNDSLPSALSLSEQSGLLSPAVAALLFFYKCLSSSLQHSADLANSGDTFGSRRENGPITKSDCGQCQTRCNAY